MSESTENTATAGEATTQPTFQPPSSQEDLDRIINAAVARTHKKYEGFEDLKAKAEQFDSIKAEKEALASKMQALEAEKERSALVADVAKEKGVPAAALRGSTREELEAHADALAELLKPSGPVIPNQDRAPDKVEADPLREFARSLFATSD